MTSKILSDEEIENIECNVALGNSIKEDAILSLIATVEHYKATAKEFAEIINEKATIDNRIGATCMFCELIVSREKLKELQEKFNLTIEQFPHEESCIVLKAQNFLKNNENN